MEERFLNTVAAASNNEESHGIRISKRNAPPSHYTLKIESFSQLCKILKKTGLEKYESDVFESGGYKWKLVLYPSGNVKRGGNDHISLYVAIAEENAIPPGSQQLSNAHKGNRLDHLTGLDLLLSFSVDADNKMRRYHSLKTENGFDQLISLKMFNDSSNGYVDDDCCVFGTEIHVIKCEGKGERFSIVEEPDDGTFTWMIEKFSTLQKTRNRSEEFSLANHKWRLLLYPKGDSMARGKSVSLFLELLNNSAHPHQRVYTEYKLTVKDQVRESHHEIKGSDWFNSKSGDDCWGCSEFMPLNDIYNASKGFLVDDTLIVEAQISLLADVGGIYRTRVS
ncbi:uncharacterized protein LOC110632000 [Hevea brasiliensis]|uniref:uncharacterized protein LOC110632000 n=1 Tax=Hevea brasiliensis TaxID=3981 RepID=UPI0025E57F38|nr:uncharacterized protein LOC110632000 [Hevea brasiliensis]